MRARSACKVFGCGRIATTGGRCARCATEYERQRGSSGARGYGADHQGARGCVVAAVEAGAVPVCWRCGETIEPGEAWDLGHDETGARRGPEHRSRCNRRAAGLRAHGKPWSPSEGRTGPTGPQRTDDEHRETH